MPLGHLLRSLLPRCHSRGGNQISLLGNTFSDDDDCDVMVKLIVIMTLNIMFNVNMFDKYVTIFCYSRSSQSEVIPIFFTKKGCS